ncbi:hypothetical protein PORY_000144 [Pneumocystis oryctolagi]|uniref:Uncharacterized protein n=1 Tax=Pneumocystis oryctolagi TaxID=42067 RepID=A0ACB7CER2_9ASCO|nr:hypothetical protein PORY_000144 [Pneumocystis oryctolagi]
MDVYDKYDLEYIDLKRLESRTRYESTLKEIFERYGRDMTEESDEVDLRTGEVIVDRGHLNNLRVSWFVGKEILNFNDDYVENDFFENILSLMSINQKKSSDNCKKLERKTFPKKFPSKEQIFQQFGSLGPSIIKLIESQKRKRTQHFKRKKTSLKCSKKNKHESYDCEAQKTNTITHLDSQVTSFKFQQRSGVIMENAYSKIKEDSNNFFIQNSQNTPFNLIHNIRRFDIVIDCPKSNHSFISHTKTSCFSEKNPLVSKSISIYPSPIRFFNQHYNSTSNSLTKPTLTLDNQPYEYAYSAYLSPESTSQSETEHSSTSTSTEQYTDSDTENTHQKKLHCNKLFCFTCSCL